MLSIVVSYEKKELEKERIKNSKEAYDLIKTLKELENQILDSLSSSVDEMLANQALIETL